MLDWKVCFSSQLQGLTNQVETGEELLPQERISLARTALLGKPDSGTQGFALEKVPDTFLSLRCLQQGLVNPLETEEELELQERMNLARTALLGKPAVAPGENLSLSLDSASVLSGPQHFRTSQAPGEFSPHRQLLPNPECLVIGEDFLPTARFFSARCWLPATAFQVYPI